MKDIRIHFDKHNLFEVAVVGGLIFALWTIRDFLLVLGMAVIISTFIEDFVVRGEKIKIPRVVSVILFYIITFVLFAGVMIFLVPVIAKELGSLSQIYPDLISFIGADTILTQPISVGSIVDFFQDPGVRDEIFARASAIFGGIFNLIVVFIVSFYLSIQKNSIDSMLRIFTPLKYEDMVISLWHRVQLKVGSWFRGQLIIALILTVATYIGLSLMGLPYAFLLSLLAGLFGLIPYGIFLAILPAIAIALIQDGWLLSVYVIIFYLGLQQILDLVLQPIIVKKMTGIPSLLVILSVIIGAKLFGIYGLLLAIPIALFAMEIIADSEKHKSKKRPPIIEHEEITITIDKS